MATTRRRRVFGACRLFEPWKAKESLEKELDEVRGLEEEGDAMKSLENRSPSPGADVEARSWCRCGRGEPSPGADVGRG